MHIGQSHEPPLIIQYVENTRLPSLSWFRISAVRNVASGQMSPPHVAPRCGPPYVAESGQIPPHRGDATTSTAAGDAVNSEETGSGSKHGAVSRLPARMRTGKAAQCEHTTLCSTVAIVKSYTPQSTDLMWLTIELETLYISGMVYGKIAERAA
eukprot:COSAG02_NODE_5302_length_4458_cov_32.131682_4_plen_154_part_00